MKNLILIFISTLFIVGCQKSEVINPPNNNNNNNNNGTTTMNYKQVISTVIDEDGDTIYSAVTNEGNEQKIALVETEQIQTDSLMFMRTTKAVTSNNPVGYSISYFKNTVPSTRNTKTIGSELHFMEELQVRCQFMDKNETIWITTEDNGSNKSNVISNVVSHGLQELTLKYREEISFTAVSDETYTDSVDVYVLSGSIEQEFYDKGDPQNNRKRFTVNYDALPVFINRE